MSISKVQSMLEEIVFRTNQETNTRYTTKDIPDEILLQRAKWPTFPLNALNYPRIQKSITTAQAKSIIQAHAQAHLDNAQDEFSFWMVEVPINEFFPIYEALVKQNSDLEEIDPKLNTIFSRYSEFFAEGIHNTEDLVKAMNQYR